MALPLPRSSPLPESAGHQDAAYRGSLTPATTVLGSGEGGEGTRLEDEERAAGEGGSDHEPRPSPEKKPQDSCPVPPDTPSPGERALLGVTPRHSPSQGLQWFPPGLGPKVESFPEASTHLPSSQLLSSPSGLPLGSFSQINRPRVAEKGHPALHLVPPGHRPVGFTTLAVTRLLGVDLLMVIQPMRAGTPLPTCL